MTDAIDLSLVTIHNSPMDVASWPITTAITRLTMAPGSSQGLNLEFSKENGPNRWPDVTPAGWDGPLEYTVWPVVSVGGAWHTAGIIQMWNGREHTGAPILTQWHDWAYDANRWGAMVEYVPKVGDPIGFFVTADNERDATTASSVRERSNVVLIQLPAGDRGDFRFDAEPLSPPVVPPAAVPIATPTFNEAAILSAISNVQATLDKLTLAWAVSVSRPAPLYDTRLFGTKITLTPRT